MRSGDTPTGDNTSQDAGTQSHDQSTTAKLLADTGSFVSTTATSLAYSAFQSPLTGVTQVVDQIGGTHIADKVQFMNAPEQAQFGTMQWHAQQIGSGLGMALDFIVAHKAVGAVGGAQTVAEEQIGSMSSAIGRSAVTGAVYQGVFSPSQTTGGNFWADRLASAGSGAMTFAALTGSSIGLRSIMGTASVESGLVTKLIKSDAALGMAAGVPAGLVAAESNSLLHGRGLASPTEALQSAYGFVVAGAPLGAMHSLGLPERSSSLSDRSNVVDRSSSVSDLVTPDTSIRRTEFPTKSFDSLLHASDKTDTQWEEYKLWCRTFDRLNVDPPEIDLTRDARDQIVSTRREVLKLSRHMGDSDEVKEISVPSTVIKLVGRDTEIVIPDGDWSKHQEISNMRKMAAMMDPMDKDAYDAAMKRAARIDEHNLYANAQAGYSRAVLPEQLNTLLDELPNSRIIKQIVLWPDSAKDVAADALRSSINIYDFQRRDVADLRLLLFHEWSHVADHKFVGQAFTHASDLEKGQFYSRDYAKKNREEDLAVHLGEEMLSPDADAFFELVDKAPLRSLVLAEMLRINLEEENESGHYSKFSNEFTDRLAYIDEVLPPIAREKISDYLNGNSRQVRNAMQLLESLNYLNPELTQAIVDQGELRRIAGLEPSKQLASGAEFTSLLEKAVRKNWLDTKIQETNSDDNLERIWAYDSMERQQTEWPSVVNVFPQIVEQNLANGGESAQGVLEWLGSNPKMIPKYLGAERLREYIKDPDPEIAASAIAAFFAPNNFGDSPTAPTLSPDMVAQAKKVLPLLVTDGVADRMLNSMFDAQHPWASKVPPELVDLLKTGMDLGHMYSRGRDAAIKQALMGSDMGLKQYALQKAADDMNQFMSSPEDFVKSVQMALENSPRSQYSALLKNAFDKLGYDQRFMINDYLDISPGKGFELELIHKTAKQALDESVPA